MPTIKTAGLPQDIKHCEVSKSGILPKNLLQFWNNIQLIGETKIDLMGMMRKL